MVDVSIRWAIITVLVVQVTELQRTERIALVSHPLLQRLYYLKFYTKWRIDRKTKFNEEMKNRVTIKFSFLFYSS